MRVRITSLEHAYLNEDFSIDELLKTLVDLRSFQLLSHLSTLYQFQAAWKSSACGIYPDKKLKVFLLNILTLHACHQIKS